MKWGIIDLKLSTYTLGVTSKLSCDFPLESFHRNPCDEGTRALQHQGISLAGV